ncbi:peroxisomal membrane anchor protein (Pex14p) conserved region domain-containing protein [Sarocladium implicatum]|nr:peroxisomal membrane anchor protein (Pex14p) conserved region domain-containing protein [Sarocladium implicatum]
MASEPGTSPAQPDSNAAKSAGQIIVDLVIVSPSVAVPQPLRFPGTPASTTIKELKAKIRDAVALHPAEENQRLIHRGRALVRDGDTLLEILSAEAIAADRQQTMHLVLRDVPTTAQAPIQPTPTTTTSSTAVRDTSPAPANGPQAQRPYAPSPQQQFLNTMQRRMLQATRESMAQAVVSQNQRGRAQMGMRGIGDNATQAARHDSRDRRASPSPAAPTGPNGISLADLQSMLQHADASNATATMTNAMNNAMQRSASSASMHNRPLHQPGVTVPMFPGSSSRAGSGRTTPFGGSAGAPRPGQEVYILSSPEGPRALLVNNTTAETYYTPRLSTRRSMPRLNGPGIAQSLPTQSQLDAARMMNQQALLHYYEQAQQRVQGQQAPQSQAHQTQQQPQQQHHGQEQQDHQQQQQQQQQQPPQGQPQVLGHPHVNPPVAAIPPLLRIVWPHLWLIFRLALFVWIFTSPGATWSRWMLILGMAVFIFILSTGALNGMAEHIMGPVGRQLDNLLPALDGQRRNGDAPRPEVNQQGLAAAGVNAEPQPAQLAQRLVDERQNRESWLTGQFRRVERASLLFLASIAPGVAERHIAHLEAEAARVRREAEEAARASAEAAEQNNETEAGEGGAASQASEAERPQDADQGHGEAAGQRRDREPEAEPLIAV